MAKLILRREDEPETDISLEETGSVTIGRSPECDITIDDTQASRRHCTVVRLQSGWEVADLGSTNGTLVNSTLVKKRKLHHGDVIRIGHHELVFHDPTAVRTGEGEIQNCTLVFARGERKGDKIELTEQRTTIGRKETNTVVIHDPVASSYHCEIVRDLNGYTIRDLGSTNGTLVNNEMITEAQLTHGARIRIGNARFVFQDPAMAEIDLELAGVEDDESEWGMMRELDLAAVRRRHPATIFYSILFVLIVAALGYLLTMERQTAKRGPQAPAGNLLEHYSFETEAAALAWLSEPAGAAEVGITTAAHGEGASSLQLRTQEEGASVFYAAGFPGKDQRYQVTAQIGAQGDVSAEIGVLWSGLGLERWASLPPVQGRGLAPLELTTSAPPWATRARLGVRAEGAGRIQLDDVALVRSGRAQVAGVTQNEFAVTVGDATWVDVAHAGAPVLFNGRPVAQGSGGAPVDPAGVRVSVELADDEHVLVSLAGAAPEAAWLGLSFEEVRRYLSQGGFRAFGYTGSDTGESYFVSAFPDEGVQELDEARKLLLGPSGRAFAVLAEGEDGRLRSVARAEGRRRLWTVLVPAQEGAAALRFKVDLRGEAAIASSSMATALDLHQSRRWGEFLEQAGRSLAEFPFASKAMRTRLRDLMQEVTREYVTLVRRAAGLLQDYDEFKDLQSLDELRSILGTLRERFQIEPGKGPRGERLAELVEAESTRREEALRKRQDQKAEAFVAQALAFNLPEGQTYSAGVLLAYVAWYLPHAQAAAQARQQLTAIEEDHPDVLKVLRELGLQEGRG